MNIIRLEAENIRHLKAIAIDFKKGMTEITGRNAQGKTSVADVINYSLLGTKALPPQPIRNGESQARAKLLLGDSPDQVELIVERTIDKSGKTKVTVTTPEGANYPKAQKYLDELFKTKGFDPLEFARMKNNEQINTLTNILGIGGNLQKLDDEYEKLYTERTFANRNAKEAKINLEAIDIPEAKMRDAKEKSSSDLSEKLEKERDTFQTIRKVKEESIDQQHQIKDLEKRLLELKNLEKDSQKELKTLESDFDVEVGIRLKKELDGIDEYNAKVRQAQEYTRLDDEYAIRQDNADALDDLIKENREKREDLIKKAEMPIKGLQIEEYIMFEGKPFEQLATSEKIQVSLAITIAMNPKLKYIHIKDGSLLDPDNFKIIKEIAEKNKFNIIIETVKVNSPTGIIIDCGEIGKYDPTKDIDGNPIDKK